MTAPTVVTIRPGVTFTPDAAASFRRAEAAWGRPIDVNSTYRDWDQQLDMWKAWEAYLDGGPRPAHSRALHPSASKHCQGVALDSDDWRTPRFIDHMAEHGWVRTAAWDKTEQHHFEYQWWHDEHRNDPAPATSRPTPEPATVPEDEEDDMTIRPTVHARLSADGKRDDEWMLGHPDFGRELPVFDGTATDQNSRLTADKSIKIFRGFMVTVDRDIFTAWARTYAKGTAQITSRTDRDGYIEVQKQLSRVAAEVAPA